MRWFRNFGLASIQLNRSFLRCTCALVHAPGQHQPPIIKAESQHHFPVQESIG